MPKMKTHRGAAKRFKRTGTGKLTRSQGHVAHYLEHKRGTLRRRLQRDALVSKVDAPRINKMLGKGR